MWNFFFYLLIELLDTSVGGAIKERQSVLIQEVPFGNNVQLSCKSNDENHIFEYWMVDNNLVIGPTNNNFDNIKFDYEILSGDLKIRAISKKDEGLYTCVSRAIRGNDRKLENIKIVVALDWEDIYEHDSNINLIRILIILIMMVLLGIGGYVVFKMWKDRYHYPSYLEHENEEEFTEEIFNRPPSTSGINRARSPGKIVLEGNASHPLTDDSNISTDFNSFLEKSKD